MKKADDDLLKEINERLELGIEGWKTNHDLALDDVYFRNGDQWDEKTKNDRENKGRPCLTFNRIESFIDQVVGDQRQGRPSIKVAPAELDMDEGGEQMKIPNLAGENDYEYSQVMSGLIKNIEYRSKAANAYDTAFDNAVGNGFGFWRIVTEYENDGFDQCIKIKRISNPFRVIIDPSAEETVKEDMEWAFIFSWLPIDKYKKEYGKDAFSIVDASTGTTRERWYDKENVRVAEYFRKVPSNYTVALLSNGAVMKLGENEDEIEAAKDKISKMGLNIDKSRKTKGVKVEWMKTDGHNILSKSGDKNNGIKVFPGKYIPVIPVFGKEINIEGEIIYRSVFRHGKDAQRNYNYWRTAATEQVALAPKAPYIGPVSAFKGLENVWKMANRENFSYLPYNDDAAQMPQRQIGAQMPAGALEEAQAADSDLKGTIGIFGAGLGEPSQQRSGKAIFAMQREGDVGTYAFHDNLSKSIEHTGVILSEIIPIVYDSSRVVRIRNDDGTEDSVKINVMDEKGRKLYDLGAAKYDITVKTGPSFTTQRIEAAEAMMEMTRQNPNLWAVLGDLIAQNMDWPGAEEMARRLQKTMDPKLLEKEEEGMQPQITEEMVQQIVQQAVIETKADMEAQFRDREISVKEFDSETKRMSEDTDRMEAEIKMLKDAAASAPDEEMIKDIVAQALAEFMQQTGGMQ